VQRPGSTGPSPNPTPETVLITGGAGFIGSHLADELLARGHRVRALDSLLPQVHGAAKRPDDLAVEVELQVGDVRDADALRRALEGVDSVVHLAARVGVGQSMYEIAEYTAVNSLGMKTGYDSKQVVQLDFQFPKNTRYTAARRVALINELHMRMAALPTVTKVASGRPPGSGGFRTAAIPIGERGGTATGAQSILHYTYVQAGYFETLGIPLFLGRGFERQTQNGQTVILSESAAKQIFRDENPLGRRIRLGVTDERTGRSNELIADGSSYQVVGLARDTRGLEFGAWRFSC